MEEGEDTACAGVGGEAIADEAIRNFDGMVRFVFRFADDIEGERTDSEPVFSFRIPIHLVVASLISALTPLRTALEKRVLSIPRKSMPTRPKAVAQYVN